ALGGPVLMRDPQAGVMEVGHFLVRHLAKLCDGLASGAHYRMKDRPAQLGVFGVVAVSEERLVADRDVEFVRGFLDEYVSFRLFGGRSSLNEQLKVGSGNGSDCKRTATGARES